MKKNLYILFVPFLFLAHAKAGQDTPQRFTLFEDKLHTHQIMSQPNYPLDMGFHVNKNFADFLEKIRNIREKDNYENQLSHAQKILQEFNKTEQAINAEILLNIPLPQFSIGSMKFFPRIEMNTRLGGLMNVQQRQLQLQEILEYVDNDVPTSIQNKLLKCTAPDPGEDIIKNAIDNNCLRNPLSSFAREHLVGQYFYPEDPNLPQVFIYGKIEHRFGPKFHYVYRQDFSGDFKIYWRGRSDIKIRITDSTLASQNNTLGIPDSVHYSNLAADYRFRYQWKKFSGFLSLEEFNLAKLNQKENLAPALYQDTSPLWRGHIQYKHRLSPSFLLYPYVGIHYRKHYDLSDGIYLGNELVYQRLHIKSQLDSEHLTLSTSFNFPWLILSGWLKTPIKEKTSTTKLSTLLGANLIVTL